MEYFILNEHSLPINDPNKIDACLVQFFEIYRIATKSNFKQIRVSNNIDAAWYQIAIGENKSLKDWISEQTYDYSTRLKSLISATQCPIYDQTQIEEEFRSGLSEFTYEGKNVPNLGAAHLLEQLSFSLDSSEIWNHPNIEIHHVELTEEDELTENQAQVKNVTTKNHWVDHYTVIEELQIEAVRLSSEIVLNLNNHFPNITFTNSAIKQLNNNNFSNTLFSEIWFVLSALNTTIESIGGDFNNELIKANSATLNISDESNTVKQNPKLKRHRLFMHDNRRHFFGYHAKNFRNQERIHFTVIENKLVIGYIGKHLPL